MHLLPLGGARHLGAVLVICLAACRSTPTSPSESQLEGPDELRAVIGNRPFASDRFFASAGSGAAIQFGATVFPPSLAYIEQLSLAADDWALGVPTRISSGAYARQDQGQSQSVYLVDSISPGTITVVGFDLFQGRLAAEFEAVLRLYAPTVTGEFTATDSLIRVESGFVRYTPRFEF